MGLGFKGFRVWASGFFGLQGVKRLWVAGCRVQASVQGARKVLISGVLVLAACRG